MFIYYQYLLAFQAPSDREDACRGLFGQIFINQLFVNIGLLQTAECLLTSIIPSVVMVAWRLIPLEVTLQLP